VRTAGLSNMLKLALITPGRRSGACEAIHWSASTIQLISARGHQARSGHDHQRADGDPRAGLPAGRPAVRIVLVLIRFHGLHPTDRMGDL